MRKLYVLGAGTPTPTAERFGSAFVLRLDDEFLMFDCGPAATHKLAKVGLSTIQIEHLFFTHHHFDHNADYPCFLLSRWDQSIHDTPRLHVRGPAPTAQITDRLIGPDGAFRDDLTARINAPSSHAVYVNRGGVLPRPDPMVHVQDVVAGPVCETGTWSVRAAVGSHMEPYLTLLVYRVDCDGLSIVFASDTKPCKPPIELARGADVMVLTCWDHQEVVDKDDIGRAMSGTRDVAEIAQQAGVKKLVLTHFCARFTEPQSLERARRHRENLRRAGDLRRRVDGGRRLAAC
jgi:ribonuclease BN (tRNA processing enzyme)